VLQTPLLWVHKPAPKWVLTWAPTWALTLALTLVQKQAKWLLNQLIPVLNQLVQYWAAHVDNENI
jgi:hypothetical protein